MIQTLLILLFCLFCFSGCARTVSSPSDTLFLDITLTTKEAIDTSKSIYVIAFSTVNTSDIQPSPLIIDDYIIFPGQPFNDSELSKLSRSFSHYYQTIYHTWTSFLFISDDSTQFISSNGPSFNRTTSDHFSYQASLSFNATRSITHNTLRLVIDIEQLEFSPSDTLYFSVFSFLKDGIYDSGFIKDSLRSTRSLLLSKHVEFEEILSEDSSIDGAVDFTKCFITLY